MTRLSFELQAEAPNSRARATRFRTLHNEVLTPVFMPVGTQATVKGMTAPDLEEVGAQVLLANTYHLLLRPGPEVFERFGGIHKLMQWGRSVLTDSGGFQIFSLPHTRRMTEDGAEFKSYVDGRLILLSPERSIAMQRAIGSDIMMVLDECVPSTSERAVAKAAVELTSRWALRSLAARGDSPQAMFAIIQGACYQDLRRQSADFLTQLPFDGFAIGGLAVGETKGEREDFTELSTELMPRHLPRYLMGVGTPLDLLEAVHRGVDMFDCILPTAHAQQGTAFTWGGLLRLRRTVYKLADEPIDPACGCRTCRTYSRAYVHHLVKAKEGLGWRLIAYHNLWFYRRLTDAMRASILDGSFVDLYRERRETLALIDGDCPPVQPKVNRPKVTPTTLGRYEVRVDADQVARIRQTDSGETMHPTGKPDEEARLLYVEQSQLEGLLSEPAEEPLVLWDVGLGAAHNAMAALSCAESLHAAGALRRPLRLVSFENDLDALRLALLNLRHFTHLRHAAPHHIASKGSWQAKEAKIVWVLRAGDFLAELPAADAPDVVYYDPFSFKTDGPLWTTACFERVHARAAERGATLLTYSTSTAVRAALLAAGFHVARGRGVGGRAESTIAFGGRPKAHPAPLLDESWLGTWERSSVRQEALAPRIRAHPQFVRLAPGGAGATLI
jgi:queuine tRNA-ribosyltransferase